MVDHRRRLRVLPDSVAEPAARRPPVFERVAVVSLGSLGASIALAARQAWPSALVIGIDRNEVLEEARRRAVFDVGADDLFLAAEADLIVLAGTTGESLRLMSQLAEVVSGEAVVTDIAPAKRAVLACSRDLPARLTFVGGRPLVDAASMDLQSARADLFVGRDWLFTLEAGSSAAAVSKLFAFARGLGARPQRMDPDEYDRQFEANT